jgi:hypothetical protein
MISFMSDCFTAREVITASHQVGPRNVLGVVVMKINKQVELLRKRLQPNPVCSLLFNKLL